MVFQRIPPSEKYDPTTGRLLGRAYAQSGRWVYTTVPRPRPGPKTAQWLRSMGIQLDLVDAGGLTAYERAFERSLWYVHNGGANGKRNARWSLQREWGPLTSKGRLIGIRVGNPRDAELAAQRKGRDNLWRSNPALQSGGQGSTKERFG